jgi:hypothetical protein
MDFHFGPGKSFGQIQDTSRSIRDRHSSPTEGSHPAQSERRKFTT